MTRPDKTPGLSPATGDHPAGISIRFYLAEQDYRLSGPGHVSKGPAAALDITSQDIFSFEELYRLFLHSS